MQTSHVPGDGPPSHSYAPHCRDCGAVDDLAPLDSSGLHHLCLTHRLVHSAHLQASSAPFARLAHEIDQTFAAAFDRHYLNTWGTCLDPKGNPSLVALSLPEHLRAAFLSTEQALTDLLRAKDAAVRMSLSLTRKPMGTGRVP